MTISVMCGFVLSYLVRLGVLGALDGGGGGSGGEEEGKQRVVEKKGKEKCNGEKSK